MSDETMSQEQAADLAALTGAAEAEAVRVAAVQVAAVEQQQAEAGAADLAGEIAGLVQAFTAVAKPILPCLVEIYTPDVSQQAAQAVAAVCVKHGWLPDGLMGRYGEEVAAAVVLLPLGVATYHGVKRDIAARQQQPAAVAAPVPGAAAVPGSDTVSFGAVQYGGSDADG